MRNSARRRLAAGSALIVLGLVLLMLQQFQGLRSEAVLFLLGGAFLAAYLYRREYGFVVPAGILLGLGVGMALERLTDLREAVPLGLGLGFLSIWVITLVYERRNRWWPLIPGGILVLIGLPETNAAVEWVFRNWPIALVVVGVLIVLGGLRGRRPARGTD